MKEDFIPVPVFDEGLTFTVSLAGISYCDGSYYIERKKSGVMTLEYIISGEGTVNCNNKTFYAKEGDTYLLLPGDNHKYFPSSENPWEKIWINASGPLINTLADVFSLKNQIIYHCDTYDFIRRMHEILADGTLTSDEIAKKVSVIFFELVQCLSENTEKKDKIPPDAETMKNYIDTNIYKSITIDDLASLIYKSPAHTIRIFKNAYGVTPYEYYMDNRIKKAISLLKDTMFSVKEIAYMLSFCDEHYFSNIFKQRTGKKPTDYR